MFHRVQQESVDDGERNLFLVNYVDFAFDDFGGRQPPVYPGLSTVWGSLARSKVILILRLFWYFFLNDVPEVNQLILIVGRPI